MKNAMIVAMVLGCVNCVDDAVSSSEQTICNEDRDTCPGGHPITLRQSTSNYANSQYPYPQTTAFDSSCSWVGSVQVCSIHITIVGLQCTFICTEDNYGPVQCNAWIEDDCPSCGE